MGKRKEKYEKKKYRTQSCPIGEEGTTIFWPIKRCSAIIRYGEKRGNFEGGKGMESHQKGGVSGKSYPKTN